MIYIIGQLVGFVAILFSFFVYSQNSRIKILICKLILDIIWSIHFLMIASYTPMLTTAVSIFRECVFCAADKVKFFYGKIIPVIFIGLYIICGLVTWHGIISLFPVLGSCIATIAFFNKKVKNIRIWSFICSVFMLLNGIAVKSLPNIVNEIITQTSLILAYKKSKF